VNLNPNGASDTEVDLTKEGDTEMNRGVFQPFRTWPMMGR
jgi:hypothetical protein